MGREIGRDHRFVKEVKPLQPEKEFILSCMKALILRDDLSVDIESSLLRKLNWDWIVRTSHEHHLLGFVAFILDKSNLLTNLDHRIQAELNAGLHQSRSENQLKQEQFQDVNRILSTKSIPVMPLKGVALTSLIYDEFPFRRMNDIDILVRQDDLNESFRLLTQAGFRLKDTYESKNRWHGEIYAQTYSLWQSPTGRIPVFRDELHLDIHFNPLYRVEEKYTGINVAGMWQRAVPFPKLGPNVFIPDPKDLVLHLILHTVEFHYPRLIQAMDTACVIQKYKISRSDISARTNVVATHSKVEVFLDAIQELININRQPAQFSPETTEVFERFFSGKSISEETQPDLTNTDEPVMGIGMVKKIRSPWKRLIFLAGYLFPNPDYYRHNTSKIPYLSHWRELIAKVWRLGRSGFGKTPAAR